MAFYVDNHYLDQKDSDFLQCILSDIQTFLNNSTRILRISYGSDAEPNGSGISEDSAKGLEKQDITNEVLLEEELSVPHTEDNSEWVENAGPSNRDEVPTVDKLIHDLTKLLVFPPLSGYHRYLLHHMIEEYFPNYLVSFSIGDGSERRSVVCYKETLSRCGSQGNVDKNDFPIKRNERVKSHTKKPTVQAYVPPAARGRSSTVKSQVLESLTEKVQSCVQRLDHTELVDGPELGDTSTDICPELLQELYSAVGSGVHIVVPTFDYSPYYPTEHDSSENMVITSAKNPADEFDHVLEAFDVPLALKERFAAILSADFGCDECSVKWFDDESAFLVFSGRSAAQQALKAKHPSIKLRALSESPNQTLRTARRCAEFLKPFRARPQTSVTVLKRMVHDHLGLERRQRNAREHSDADRWHNYHREDSRHHHTRDHRRSEERPHKHC